MVQVGDAAHAFLPTSVNGGTQAFEDAVSLPCCLRIAINQKGLEGISTATKGPQHAPARPREFRPAGRLQVPACVS